MNKFETMAIPIEADGIVDDEDAFEDQQKINEAQLREEIESAQQGDELPMNSYEDMQFIPYKETGNKEVKIAKRKQVLGHVGFKVFAKVRLS